MSDTLCDNDWDSLRNAQCTDDEIAVHLEMHAEGRCPQASDESFASYTQRVRCRLSDTPTQPTCPSCGGTREKPNDIGLGAGKPAWSGESRCLCPSPFHTAPATPRSPQRTAETLPLRHSERRLLNETNDGRVSEVVLRLGRYRLERRTASDDFSQLQAQLRELVAEWTKRAAEEPSPTDPDPGQAVMVAETYADCVSALSPLLDPAQEATS